MRAILGLAFVCFVCTFAAAPAAPARPRHVPAAAPQMPKQLLVNLNGTAWLGKYGAANRVFLLEADGTVSYRSSTAKAGKFIKGRGSWKVQGNRLFFDHHIGSKRIVMEFRGIVTDANTIVGESIMINTGAKSQQTLQRVP